MEVHPYVQGRVILDLFALILLLKPEVSKASNYCLRNLSSCFMLSQKAPKHYTRLPKPKAKHDESPKPTTIIPTQSEPQHAKPTSITPTPNCLPTQTPRSCALHVYPKMLHTRPAYQPYANPEKPHPHPEPPTLNPEALNPEP